MYETKKFDLRLRALESHSKAQNEALVMLFKSALSTGAPDLQRAMELAAAFKGPSGSGQALAELAKRAITAPI